MITDDEIRQFDEAGAVTIDTPLTQRQISAACEALDRLLPFKQAGPGEVQHYRASLTDCYYDSALVDIIQHLFFEEVAKLALRSTEVKFFQSAIVNAFPEPNKPFGFEQHVDIQLKLSDFQSKPKRIICSFFLWLTDVNEKRAPMMVRPGSHLQIAQYHETNPEAAEIVGRVRSVPMAQLPVLPYSDPIPLLAKAGQVSVLTTTTVHGASVNVDSVSRKNLVITFTTAGLRIGLPPSDLLRNQEFYARLRPHLRPERGHILPEAAQ